MPFPTAFRAAALLAAAAPLARAQSGGTLAGVVALAGADDLSPAGAPIPNATLMLGDAGRIARSDSAGRFSLAAVAPGTYRVLVRALGFQPLELTARVGPGDTTWLQLGVQRAAPQLATVTVRDRASSGLAGFDARRATGYGKYFDQETLQKNVGRQLSELLSTVPGVRLVPQPDGTTAVASRRGQMSILSTTQCYMSVYVDGMRLYEPTVAEGQPAANPTPGVGGPPPSLTTSLGTNARPVVNVNLLDLAQLGGVEVYPGAARLPAEFQGTGNACGAIVIWTRRR